MVSLITLVEHLKKIYLSFVYGRWISGIFNELCILEFKCWQITPVIVDLYCYICYTEVDVRLIVESGCGWHTSVAILVCWVSVNLSFIYRRWVSVNYIQVLGMGGGSAAILNELCILEFKCWRNSNADRLRLSLLSTYLTHWGVKPQITLLC